LKGTCSSMTCRMCSGLKLTTPMMMLPFVA
jgi:hypothetical protein